MKYLKIYYVINIMSQTIYEYMVIRYTKMGLLDSEGNRTIPNNSMWNPFIYPDNGYIPPCSVCKNCYEEFVALIALENNKKQSDEITWPHHNSGCLWSEYYEDKLRQLNINIRFVKNKMK
jgi:hypothetical protein